MFNFQIVDEWKTQWTNFGNSSKQIVSVKNFDKLPVYIHRTGHGTERAS